MRRFIPVHPEKRPATLVDVGRAAGVSAMAASAVLNCARPPWPISPQTRQRILAAAAELDYRPNIVAQALVNRRKRALNRPRLRALGVVFACADGEVGDYLLEGCHAIIAAAAQRGQCTTMFTLSDWRFCHERLLECGDGRIDGVILLAPTLAFSRRELPEGVPLVTLQADRAWRGCVNIESDEEAGADTLVRHLVACGHRRILHVSGPGSALATKRRIRGYRLALRRAKIGFDPQLVVAAGFSRAGGYEATRRWLERHGRAALPDAVFCASDAIASGCLEALSEAGLRVPQDVSVAGFDDTITARTAVPQLTTVRQPWAAMAARAVELLLAQIEAGKPSSRRAAAKEVFPMKLVRRASVGARG